MDIDSQLFRAAGKKADDAEAFRSLLNKSNQQPSTLLQQERSTGNTLLHVAAANGNTKIVKLIVEELKSILEGVKLISVPNKKGDTALHLVARGGFVDMVDVLVENDSDVLEVQNQKSSTAAHDALLSGHYTTAEKIINKVIPIDPAVLCLLNDNKKSPVYLAVELGRKELVNQMLQKFDSNPESKVKLLDGKSLLWAAISVKNLDLMKCIAKAVSDIIQNRDVDEWMAMAIHYAASIGYAEGIEYLIGVDNSLAIAQDTLQLAVQRAAQLAAENGHVALLKKLLERCPHPLVMVDGKGNNILHQAAMHGKHDVVKYILRNPELESLINEENSEGNTPLHLATEFWHPNIVIIMTRDKRVDLKIANGVGFTALDIAYKEIENFSNLRKRLTVFVLESAGATRAQRKDNTDNDGKDENKDRASTLLLVATLIATVTFAAGFTMPGGYNSSTGKAVMLDKIMFSVFLFCDTVALYSSITSAVTLIWTQLGDPDMVVSALRLAVPLLGVALVLMSLAFMAGIYVVVKSLTWLGIVILIVSLGFVIALVLLFGPLCLPLSSSNQFVRPLNYCTFQLLIWITAPESNSDQDIE